MDVVLDLYTYSMRVCMHVCMHACMYVRMYVCVRCYVGWHAVTHCNERTNACMQVW